MSVEFIYPEFEVIRNTDRCIACRVCERQCANEVHTLNEEKGVMMADETKCVNCQRCVSLCPTRALKIVKSDCVLRENANWQNDTIKEIYKQANSGGVLLSSMGNPKPLPVYWDKILINASQVTNPPIDPLREPMETRVFLGKKPEKVQRDEDGKLKCELPPQIELSMPIMFSAMSYGSISYNAHASLARAATELGILYNTGEGGLHEDFYVYGENTIVQVASGRFGVHEDYLKAGAAIEIKMGQGICMVTSLYQGQNHIGSRAVIINIIITRLIGNVEVKTGFVNALAFKCSDDFWYQCLQKFLILRGRRGGFPSKDTFFLTVNGGNYLRGTLCAPLGKEVIYLKEFDFVS